MNFDDLMDVWRAQNVSPLDGVNESLVRVALLQHERRLQRVRRIARAVLTVVTVLIVVDMMRCLYIMTYNTPFELSLFDRAIPIIGATAAIRFARLMVLRRRLLREKEQRFGDSLRDQLTRELLLLDRVSANTDLLQRLGNVALPVTCAIAMFVAHGRISGRAFDNTSSWIPVILFATWVAFRLSASNLGREWLGQKLGPRKRRLEALVQQLDADDHGVSVSG